MPSPFPGMDPFLEEPGEWPDLHNRMITTVSEMLAERVAPNFFVRIEQCVYITTPDDLLRQQVVPDLYLIRGSQEQSTGMISEAITTPTLVEPLYELEVRERYLEIHDARSREVVTTIELLSPSNKVPGTKGQEAFQRKRQAVLASPTHWLEIDLLRAGERPREVAGQSDYYALLKRGGGPGPFAVWYIDLRDRLPTIAVPLRPPFPDVPLDLQAAFNTLYTRAYYALSIDYSRPVPPPPLLPADADWVAACLQRWREQPD
jgi:hypothetical protein